MWRSKLYRKSEARFTMLDYLKTAGVALWVACGFLFGVFLVLVIFSKLLDVFLQVM
jgi:uncharacterized membrane protein